jgi:putative ABC transport system permease protein
VLVQIAAVTRLNLLSLPRRAAASAVAAMGIAGVALVLVGLLAIEAGMRRALTLGADPLTAVVLRAGAEAETASFLTRESARIIENAPGIARAGDAPLLSAELVMVVSHTQLASGRERNLALRGVQPAAFALRPELRIRSGRSFEPSRHELIVGSAIARQNPNLAPGRSVHWGGVDWQIVGSFESGGTSSESELWCDVAVLQQVFRRPATFHALYARLASPDAFAEFKAALRSDRRLEVDVWRELDYAAEQSRSLTRGIRALGAFVGWLMGIGAVLAALSALHTAVAARAREIATLRALGFGALPVVCSVLAEAGALGAIGGCTGALAGWLLFDGYTASTLSFASLSQVAFAFTVTPGLIARALGAAVALGLLGALLPAWQAARLGIVQGLRS